MTSRPPRPSGAPDAHAPAHGGRHDRLRLDLAWGALGFGVGAPAVYAVVRVWEQLRDGAGDPGLVLHTAHTGFLWRVLIASWGGALFGILAGTLSRRGARTLAGDLERASRRAQLGEVRTAILLAVVLVATGAVLAVAP